MSRRPSHALGMQLTRTETILGWAYLPFYLVLLSVALQYLLNLLHLPSSPLVLNTVYFCVNLAAVLLIFRRFLSQRFFGPGFWDFLQALILGFVFYYAANALLAWLLEKLVGPLTVFNNDSVKGLVAENKYVMLFAAVILVPITEETLLRGLVFGSIRRASRVMAYITSIFLFSLMHNWQFFGAQPLKAVLLNCLLFLPASGALCWTYEKAGTIWAPITLHALINAISYGVVTLH